MTEPGATPDIPRRMTTPRTTLLMASLLGAAPGVLFGGVVAATVAPTAGASFIAGVLVVLFPQLWFVIRGTRDRQLAGAAGLAVAKLSLVTLGYALWFALVPVAELLPTVVGSATTLVLMTWTLFRSQRSMQID